mgnify:CR=1 FL=1
MADNVTYQDGTPATPPDATVVATDDVGGAHYQRMKLVDGTDGATTGAKVSSEGNLQTITPNRTASGTLGALNDAVTIACDDGAVVRFYVASSNLLGTLVLDSDSDGTTWDEGFLLGYDDWNGAFVISFDDPAAQQMFIAPIAGYRRVRLRVDSYTSGSAVIHATVGRELSSIGIPLQAMRLFGTTEAAPLGPVAIANGGGVEQLALRVTVASDSTGVLSVDDNGGALTVDGTVTAAAQPGVDIGDVTINNAGAGAAVNIQDGGNTITVDGSVTANLAAGSNNIGDVDVLSIAAGDNNIGNVDVVSLPALVAGSANIGDVDVLTVPAPLSTTGGGTEATALRVTVANNSTGVVAVTQSGTWDEVGINDSGNSITVDQATGTNLHTVIDSGTVTAVTSITNAVTVAGGAAHASPVSGNPNLVAGRASTAIPTDVGADGDAASLWTNRNGAVAVLQAPHIGLNSDPWNLLHEGAQYTAAQTSTVLVAGGAGDKIVVTQMQIQAFSTTAGTVVVYFGTGAFSRGTNRTIFDGEFKPSTTLAPGAILTGPFISGANGDDILVTTVGDIDITISCWYYIIT